MKWSMLRAELIINWLCCKKILDEALIEGNQAQLDKSRISNALNTVPSANRETWIKTT
jgi:hypothetical protein